MMNNIKSGLTAIIAILIILCVFVAWGEEAQRIDEQNMQESYEWSVSYIRALTVMNERFYRDKNLERMTQLHAVLDCKNKSCPYIVKNKLTNSWVSIVANDFAYHQTRREYGDMTVGDVILPWIAVQDRWFDAEH
jgi:hypothetical protein